MTIATIVVAALGFAQKAQGQELFKPEQLTRAPKLTSPVRAAELITEAYPEALKARGVGGTVQIQFVIREDGTVDPNTVQVVASAHDELAVAAEKVIVRLEFEPGKVGDAAVRSQVVLPLVFRAR